MSESPMKQEQETWLFTHFMRKRAASIWLGVITLLITGFVVINGFVVKYANTAITQSSAVAVEMNDHEIKQARREGTVDATLKSIDATLVRIEKLMDKEK